MSFETYAKDMKTLNVRDEDLKFATLIITTAANIDKSREKAKDLFWKFDADQNGYLDKEEIKQMIDCLAEEGDLYLPQCVNSKGGNKDNKKAYEEILFNEFDKNKDAKFSLEEITNFVYFPTIGKYMKDFMVNDPIPILIKAKKFIEKFISYVNLNKKKFQKIIDQSLIGKKNKYELMNEYFGEGVEEPGTSIINDYFYLTMFWGFFSYGSEDAYLISSIPNVMRQIEIIKTLPKKIDDAMKLADEFLRVLDSQGYKIIREKREEEKKEEEKKEEEKKEEEKSGSTEPVSAENKNENKEKNTNQPANQPSVPEEKKEEIVVDGIIMIDNPKRNSSSQELKRINSKKSKGDSDKGSKSGKGGK